MDNDFYKEVLDIKNEYYKNKFVFVSGERINKILLSLGAKKEDIKKLKNVSNNLGEDPTLNFRQSKNGRFCFNLKNKKLNRLKFQPFILSENENFKRHDSGQMRKFRGIQDELQLNTAFQSLMIFQMLIFKDMKSKKRSNLNYKSKKWISTVFNLRTITTKKIIGEPALEGVHADGVDHTMTTLLDYCNMTSKSAVSYIHDNLEDSGIRYNDADNKLVYGSCQHINFLDTLLILDNERKHSLSPVYALNEKNIATRDMLIFFTRKPTTEKHKSFMYDSLDLHEEIPMEVLLNNYL